MPRRKCSGRVSVVFALHARAVAVDDGGHDRNGDTGARATRRDAITSPASRHDLPGSVALATRACQAVASTRPPACIMGRVGWGRARGREGKRGSGHAPICHSRAPSLPRGAGHYRRRGAVPLRSGDRLDRSIGNSEVAPGPTPGYRKPLVVVSIQESMTCSCAVE